MRRHSRSVRRLPLSSACRLLIMALLGLTGCQIGATAPVPAANRIYVFDFENGYFVRPDSSGIAALDVRDGHVVWRHAYAASGTALPSFEFPPFPSGDSVYAGYDAQMATLEALDADSGSTSWRQNASVELAGPPAVSAGSVYVASRAQHAFAPGAGPASGQVEALDADQGSVLWRVPVDGYPSPPTLADGRVIISVYRQPAASWDVLALDAASGRQVWDYVSPKSLFSGDLVPIVAPTPTGEHSVLVGALVRAPDGLATSTDLALSARDGELLWSYEPGGMLSPPTLAGDTVCLTSITYGTNEVSTRVVMLDLATGHTSWSALATGMTSACVVSGESVYLSNLLPSRAGSLLALDARTGRPPWTASVAPVSLSGPVVVANDAVYLLQFVNTGGKPSVAVDAIGAEDGHVRWWRDLGVAPNTPGLALDVVSDVVVVFGTSFWRERAYAARDGTASWEH